MQPRLVSELNNKNKTEEVQEELPDFFELFLDYTSGTEVPTFFYRWSMIAGLGAWLARDVWITHGHQKIYPNMYVVLMGDPGTKKSTAIKRVKKLLKGAGYDTFAAEKISKEKFLLDLGSSSEAEAGDFLDGDLWNDTDVKECFIAADEFNDFFANNILEFCSTLGVLWDYDGIYENKIKNGQSVQIPNPTISILGGTTATTFSTTFPPEIIGQGFFSRTIAVHARPTGKRITFPKSPSDEDTAIMYEYLTQIKGACQGELMMTDEARDLIDQIYQTWEELEDIRFQSYANRRLMHLLKMIIIHTMARLSPVVEARDVIYANTVLHHTELFMPAAYGEFGQSNNSKLTHKILQVLDSTKELLTLHTLWQKVQTDFDRLPIFAEHIQGMIQAKKIQVQGEYLLPLKKAIDTDINNGMVDYSVLTREEKGEL